MPKDSKGANDGVNKRKQWGTKHVLQSSFATPFPEACAGTTDAVCALLRDAFPQPPLRRRLRRVQKKYSQGHRDPACSNSSGRNSKCDTVDRLSTAGAVGPNNESLEIIGPQRADKLDLVLPSGNSGTKSDTEMDCAQATGKSCCRPNGLFVGINEVTKSLERGRARLAVVARDVSPQMLIAHIPTMCYTRNVDLVVVSGGGSDAGVAIGVKRLLAFAVADPNSIPEGPDRVIIDKLLTGLRPMATNLQYPWLAAAQKNGPIPQLAEPIVGPAQKRDIVLL
jgi:large subunit ribosomal protein L7Ae